MKILWMTWKDRSNPLTGGAEVVNEELAKRLAKDGHEVIFLVAGFPGASSEETVRVSSLTGSSPKGEHSGSRISSYKIIRVGTRWTVYYQAYKYYKQHLVGWADLIIDEVNTMPFFAKFYVKEPNILFVHMLCRRIWFYEMPFPLSIIGYVAEPIYLWLLRDRKVITVSESTKADLERNGFKADKINIISEGLEIAPLTKLPPLSTKAKQPTLISLGSIRSMKRTLHQVQAFEIAKESIPDLQLVVVGGSVGKYGEKVERAMSRSKYSDDIKYYGHATQKKKLELLRKAHWIIVTSVKEGWGLIVTEAASQGTPAIVYDVDGLRDSVRSDNTGHLASKNTPTAMARMIVAAIRDSDKYELQRKLAWGWSKSITFSKGFRNLLKVVKI